jgi:hypothetical protein
MSLLSTVEQLLVLYLPGRLNPIKIPGRILNGTSTNCGTTDMIGIDSEIQFASRRQLLRKFLYTQQGGFVKINTNLIK